MFNTPWVDSPGMHIKTFAMELNKGKRAIAKITIPCEEKLKIIVYIANIYVYKLFTVHKMIAWENSSLTDCG